MNLLNLVARLPVRQCARDLMDLCYPDACAACDGLTDGYPTLCPTCRNELATLAAAGACGRCGGPVEFDDDQPCGRCGGRGVRPFDRVVRLGTFGEPLRAVIHGMKYAGRWPLAEVLAERLWEQERVKSLLVEADVLVPVPLHPWRQIARGYNQAEVLARRLGKASGVPVAHPAERVRRTPPQIGQSRAARIRNVRKAFALADGRAVHGRRVVLVDDVMTTGATLRALARVLRPAKPASLSVLVVAVADPKHKDFQAA